MRMSDKPQGQSFANLPRSKKTAVILLSAVAASILVIWFWQFNTRINKPFNPDPDQKALADAKKEQAAASEKVRDTDLDGLSDYDETNIWQTSPFIEDTDGDGISDGQEVANNTDPLCPQGQDCSASQTPTVIATSTTSTPQDIANTDQALLIKAVNGTADAASLRSLLLQNGANQTDLDSISDADLMASYADMLKAQNPTTLETANSVVTSTVSQ